MKGRSNRLPAPSAPSEDWGDGSWTVDCPCGVTFDDGEEMVDCDVCGVWVHTRCSRFVKGEASFACDKCKGRKPRLFSSSPASAAEQKGNHYNCNTSGAGGTNTEETEVAQLLVELPTKTDPYPPLAAQRPQALRLWTRAPIEERVHVQGVPGGDPSLFQGLSSVFTSELWKCAGYVPKKFNFKYKEFPCWDDEEENDNPASRGADLLFSLSKEITQRGPVESYGQRPSPKVVTRGDEKGFGSGGGGGGRLQASMKKERNKIRVIGLHSGKRKEEHAGKDQSNKKKPRTSSEKVVSDNKKRGSCPLVKTCKSNIYEDSASHFAKLDSEYVASEDRKDDMSLDTTFSDHHETTEYDLKPKHVVVIKASSGSLSNEPLQSSLPVEAHGKVETCDERDGSRTRSKVDVSIASPVATSSVKEEDFNAPVNVLRCTNKEGNDPGVLNEDSCGVLVKSEKSKPEHGAFRCASSDVLNVLTDKSSNTMISPNSVKVKVEVEPVGQDGQDSACSVLPPALVIDEILHGTERSTEHPETSVVHPPEDLQINDTAKSPSSCKDKSLDAEMESKIRHLNQEKISDRIASRSSELRQNEQETEESPGPRTGEEGSSESVHLLKYEETAKPRSINSSSFVSTEIKLDLTLDKSSLSSAVPTFSKLSVLGMHKSPGSAASSTAERFATKHRVKMNAHTVGKKENSTISVSSEEHMREITRQSTKGHLIGSTSSESKSSQTCKASYSNTKHASTDSKEHLHCPPSKLTSRAEKTVKLSSFGETTASQQNHGASIQTKPTSTGSCQKNENLKHPPFQSSSKVSHSMAILPPSINAYAQLSDEELALLLHQELNSSPRVPRVPRIRQASGFQLTTSAATSILSRRSSGAGAKDQTPVSRRKNKEDGNRDSSRGDESKKVDRFPSPDTKKEDSMFPMDASAKKDGRSKSCDSLSSSKKSIQLCSVTGANNGSSSSIEADGDNALSVRNSPKNVSGDDAATHALTLPGLIDEIMSKGKCMTYEELCSEVLPHWRNLRKPNGERYAYSSHSQAVLDCLRNRNEWAHLIDRGPKTNSSRKRRKFAVDSLESDNEEANRTPGEAEEKDGDSHREDVPKGKRKARKRRLLALQGRSLKVSKSRKQDSPLEDEAPSSSPSSDDGAEKSDDGAESIFSDDEESQGTGPYGDQYTSSSDDS